MKYRTFKYGFIGGKGILQITSDFGKRRLKGKKETDHNGIDIGVPVGTVLSSPCKGTVMVAQVKGKAGLYVLLRCYAATNIYFDVYFMHLNNIEKYISVGYVVSEGEKIGTTGGAAGTKNAGSSEGPHLHLEVRDKGKIPVDPKPFFKEQLVSTKTGMILKYKSDEYTIFSENLKSQTSFYYKVGDDVTVPTQTERDTLKTAAEKPKVDMESKERNAPGIWSIVKILIDKSVEDKQVLDSSMATQQGSIINFFRKICQEPLVEFSGDTFGSQYYWFVRKPPFDKEGFERLIENTKIDLSGSDIITTDLSWNNEGIYSWYQYMPIYDIITIDEVKQFMPSVFFQQFASIWGSKPLSIESNYFNWIGSGAHDIENDDAKMKNVNEIVENVMRDYKFLIESNAYNAFTRKGSITIVGDRRIKRGTVISIPSGEVFYVDAVMNNYSVNINGTTRTTTLSVSKGIFPAYIKGKKIGGKIYSYFNLIDFGKLFESEDVTIKNWEDYVSKFKVNDDVFGFFMSKQQVLTERINNEGADYGR